MNIKKILIKNNPKKKFFYSNFCNLEGMKSIVITFDIDWAPEFMIENLLNLTKGLNITIFNTHKSKIISTINSEKITLGIHPNLSKNSSQGDNIKKVSNFVSKIGNNKFCRFHILGHSYPDMCYFAKKGTKVDSSYFLLNQPYIIPSYHKDIDLLRIPYIWEDGLVLRSKMNIKNSLNLNLPGMKILDFHPIDLYLNTHNFEHRNKFKKKFKSIIHSTKKDAEKFVNTKIYGIRDFFNDLKIQLNKKKNLYFQF